jgi:hypothetical protein
MLPDGNGLDLTVDVRRISDVQVPHPTVSATLWDAADGLFRGRGLAALPSPLSSRCRKRGAPILPQRPARLSRPEESKGKSSDAEVCMVFPHGFDPVFSPGEFSVLHMIARGGNRLAAARIIGVIQ